MKQRKSFLIAGIFSALAVFCLLFAACPEDDTGPVKEVTVKTNADNGPGSLRDYIDTAPDGGTIIIAPNVGTIELTSRLYIKNDLIIKGNGVTLTRAASWTTVDRQSQLMHVQYKEVTVSRIHFKDGKASENGGAVYNSGATLTLESCIFSGNNGGSGEGGAVYSFGNTVIKGCTFYRNSAHTGGAVSHSGSAERTMTLTGNLFYGNTASSRNPVVYRFNAALTSGGYNVVDVAYGTGNNQAGWTANANDKSVTDLLITSASFRLFHGSGAAGIIGELPAGYPDNDFYGTRITAPASAGAVQDTASENGYILATTVNNSDRGSVSVTPPPDADGLYSGTVSVTAVPAEGYGFSYWLVDGDNAGDSNPLELTVTDHTSVQAVFAAIIVNKYTDVSGSAETQGTFRYALAKAQSGETIRLSNVTPGQTVIKLTGRLPTIYRDITIEGNGVTLTRDAAWTTEDNNSQLMWISGTVTIRGIHFKDGRASTNGAAIRIDDGGDLTLESCIFSGNQTSSLLAYGGAIYTRGNLNVKGCTFCENDSVYQGGAIYAPFDVTITLTGNLFYGNTAERSLILYHSSFFGATVISTYNVVDVIYGLGDGNAGWTAGTGDSTFTELGISGNPLNTATFAPVPGLGSVIPAPPEGFPATDFYGNQRTFPGAPGAVR